MEHKRSFVEDDIMARNSIKNKNILKCEYPGCNKEGDHRHVLNLVNEADASVDLPFCRYHYFIVIGGHFEARVSSNSQNFEIIGPFHEVEISEQVIGAREMIAKLKSDDKSL